MTTVVVLDTGPVGMITNPNASGANRECYNSPYAEPCTGVSVRKVEKAERSALR
jgi:hypothetical protein